MSYDPTIGRWIEADPARYIDGPNEYEMERDDPASLLDPSGLQSVGGGQNCMQHATGVQLYSIKPALDSGVIRPWRFKKWTSDPNQEFKDYYKNPALMRAVLDAYFKSRGMTTAAGSTNTSCGCNTATHRVVCVYIYKRTFDWNVPYDMHWIVQHTDGSWSGKPGLAGPPEATSPKEQADSGKILVGCWVLNSPAPAPLPPPPSIDDFNSDQLYWARMPPVPGM